MSNLSEIVRKGMIVTLLTADATVGAYGAYRFINGINNWASFPEGYVETSLRQQQVEGILESQGIKRRYCIHHPELGKLESEYIKLIQEAQDLDNKMQRLEQTVEFQLNKKGDRDRLIGAALLGISIILALGIGPALIKEDEYSNKA